MNHGEKFANFIALCKQESPEHIIVASLGVLGDTIEEIEANIDWAKECNKSIILADSDIKITKAYID